MSYVIDALNQHGEKQPDHTAIIAGKDRISYGQLLNKLESFVQLIASTHCHTVGIDLDNSLPWVLADLAAMKLGLTAVPIPGFFFKDPG